MIRRFNSPLKGRNARRLVNRLKGDNRMDSGAGDNADAGGGNDGGTGGESQEQNNTGDKFDIDAFFSEEGDGADKAPSGESTADSESSSSTERNLAQEVNTELASMDFGTFMTPEVFQNLQSGDPAEFNKGITEYGRNIAKQAVGMSVGIMRHLSEKIMSDVDQRIQSHSTNTRNYDALVKAIPSAGTAKAGKTVKNIYDRALAQSKGNVEKAIETTKNVIQIQAETFGNDLGFEVAPRSSGDRGDPTPKTNWSEALLSR